MTTTSYNALFINDHTYAVPPSSAPDVESDADSVVFRKVALANVAGDDGLYAVGGLYRNGQLVSVAVESESVLDDALVQALLSATKDEVAKHLTSVPAPAPAPAPEPQGSCTCVACDEHKDNPESNKCGNCEDVLHDWVHIYCLVNTDGEETTFCTDCWQDLRKEMMAEGWKDANAEDNSDDGWDD